MMVMPLLVWFIVSVPFALLVGSAIRHMAGD